jgi:hypothetical protein
MKYLHEYKTTATDLKYYFVPWKIESLMPGHWDCIPARQETTTLSFVNFSRQKRCKMQTKAHHSELARRNCRQPADAWIAEQGRIDIDSRHAPKLRLRLSDGQWPWRHTEGEKERRDGCEPRGKAAESTHSGAARFIFQRWAQVNWTGCSELG